MEPINHRLTAILVIVLALITILVQARLALADTYLIQSYTVGDSSASGWLTMYDNNGNVILDRASVYQWCDSEYQYSSMPGQPVGFDRPLTQFGDGGVKVGNWAGYAKTDWCTNAVKVGLSGTILNETNSYTFTGYDLYGNLR